jgi:hypothetical protein
MKAFFKFVFALLIIGVVAGVVASIVSKKKLEAMSDDEIREFLGLKLSGKVGDDQLVTIQEAVISGVRGKQPSVDHYIDEVADAIDDLEDVVDDGADKVEDDVEAATDAVEDATE